MSGNHDQFGQHKYGAVHKAARKAWGRMVSRGGVACWRCGGPIAPNERWDLGHVDEEGRRAGLPLRHPEHIGCNRATLSHAKGNGRPSKSTAKVKRDHFDGLPDPQPDNTVVLWSCHWPGPFNPRCPECRRLRAPCPDAKPEAAA
jgi:hypothetical protein